MHITFLIGNGFDLNLGLKTSFNHFIQHYLKITNFDERIVNFKRIIGSDLIKDNNSWSYAEKKLGEITEIYGDEKIDDYIYCLKDFTINLSEYLKKQEDLIEYNINTDDYNELRKSVNNFELFLNFKGHADSIFYMKKKHENEEWYFNFINFNYTSVLEKMLKFIIRNESNLGYHSSKNGSNNNNKLEQIIHIHGMLNNNMIMGVDNIQQILCKSYQNNSEIIKSLVKPKINSLIKSKNDLISLDIINKSTIICIFGMSFGETDLTWWKNIANWLIKSNENILIIYEKDFDFNPILPLNTMAKDDFYFNFF